jgi:hypothetical protein
MKTTPIIEPPTELVVLASACIYCKKGVTENHQMLLRVNAPGEYWQHWDFQNNGCLENTENIDPLGKKYSRGVQ